MRISRKQLLKKVCKAGAIAAVAAMGWSCEDKLLYDIPGSYADHPVFMPSMGSSWSKGQAGSRSIDTEIRIDSLDQKDGDRQLFLISEEDDLGSYVASASDAPQSRGFTSTAIPGAFGLSAVCYDGKEEASDDDLQGNFTANFASNLKTEPNASGSSIWEPGTRLVWPGSGRIRFMGYAPYAADGNGITHSVSGYPTLTFKVKPEVKEQVDLLTATADVPGSAAAAVPLTFNHALAAITVRSGDEMLAGTITKVSITGVYDQGTLPLGTEIPVWTIPEGASATAEFNAETKADFDYKNTNNPYALPGLKIAGIYKNQDGAWEDDGLTFFMIPQILPNSASLNITLTDKFTGQEWTLSAPLHGTHKDGDNNDVANEWKPGRLYTYSISTTGIVVSPYVKIEKKEVRDFKTNGDGNKKIGVNPLGSKLPYSGAIHDLEMTAYVKLTQAGKNKTVTRYVPFRMQYSYDYSETNPQDATWEECPSGGWLSDGERPSNPVEPFKGSMIFPALNGFNKLMSASSKSGITDLSNLESANCYMVGSAGDYKFRTVYGNSYKGSETKMDFKTPEDKQDPGMSYFVDHNNKEILHGNIADHLSLSQQGELLDAFILWQDSPGLISRVKYKDDFISFHVDENSIAEGNAVIALRNTEGDIVWSWHIWVTPEVWTKSNCTNINEHYMAPTMLGRCKPRNAVTGDKISMRIVFDLKECGGNDIAVTEFIVKDKTESEQEERQTLLDLVYDDIRASLAGDNTYYQWGRKDAMVPGIYDTYEEVKYTYLFGFHYVDDSNCDNMNGEITMYNKPIFQNPKDYAFVRSNKKTGVSVGEAIRYPNRFIMGEESTLGDYRKHWHNPQGFEYLQTGGCMYNMWNATSKQYYHRNSDNTVPNNNPTDLENGKVGKSIYDPCPPGFHVPHVNVYSEFMGISSNITYSHNHSYDTNKVKWDKDNNCWILKSNRDGKGDDLKFYATGLRDFNFKKAHGTAETLEQIHPELPSSWAAYKMLTFITSSSIMGTASTGFQVFILYFDNRETNISCGSLLESNNSYGLTVWPEHD